jgi:hypothetical protein
MRSANSVFNHASHSPFAWLLLCIVMAAVASNLIARDPAQSSGLSAAAAQEDAVMVREGARIEGRPMRARISGDTLIWQAEDSRQAFETLENLALERVLHAIRNDTSDRQWTVTGTVTEFQGRNYILLERVTRAARTP